MALKEAVKEIMYQKDTLFKLIETIDNKQMNRFLLKEAFYSLLDAEKYIIEESDYIELKDKIEDLEEENYDLKNFNEDLESENNKLNTEKKELEHRIEILNEINKANDLTEY